MPTINGKACVVDGMPVDKVYSNGRQIYGRNLIAGSESPVMVLCIASPTGTNVYSTKTSDGWQRFFLNDGSIKLSDTELLPQTIINFNVTAGVTYTQSLEIRTDATVDLSTINDVTWFSYDVGHFGHDFQTAIMTKTGDQTYLITCTYTPKVAKNVRALDMLLYNIAYTTSGTFLDLRHGKAEISQNATPWTPAPEDVM